MNPDDFNDDDGFDLFAALDNLEFSDDLSALDDDEFDELLDDDLDPDAFDEFDS